MPYFEFLWTPDITQHIADNEITKEEFENVVCDPLRIEASYSSGHPCAVGKAYDGRLILCVYERLDAVQVLPVTPSLLRKSHDRETTYTAGIYSR